jgi:hypothetical protein
MGFQLSRTVGVAVQIRAIGVAVAKQHVHHAASEGAVGAGTQDDPDVSLLHRVVVVDVDRRDPGAPLLPSTRGVGHDVDLGGNRICAPDHHEVGLGHLPRVDARHLAGAGRVAGPGDVGTDRRVEPRVLLDVGEPIDAVPHHQPHRSGVVIGPDRLGSELGFRRIEAGCDLVQRLVPADTDEVTGALGAHAAHRKREAVRMMDTLGIARHLGADDAGRVGLKLRAANASDG